MIMAKLRPSDVVLRNLARDVEKAKGAVAAVQAGI